MSLKKDIPCSNHRLAISDKNAPELKGMRKAGIRFKKCERCGWYIKTYRKSNNIILQILKERKRPYDNIVEKSKD